MQERGEEFEKQIPKGLRWKDMESKDGGKSEGVARPRKAVVGATLPRAEVPRLATSSQAEWRTRRLQRLRARGEGWAMKSRLVLGIVVLSAAFLGACKFPSI